MLGIENAVIVNVNGVRQLLLERLRQKDDLEDVALSRFPPLPPFPLMVLDENQTLYGDGSPHTNQLITIFKTTTPDGFIVEVSGCRIWKDEFETWGQGAFTPLERGDIMQLTLYYDQKGRYVGLHGTEQEISDLTEDDLVIYTPKSVDESDVQMRLATDTFAINLMHCKNITMRDAYPKRAERRLREREGKLPLTVYKVLEIDPARTPGGGVGMGKGGKMPLHIARGHFATYTADKPLFGKFTGTFWKPMHVRGKKAHGEVKKDYSVKS